MGPGWFDSQGLKWERDAFRGNYISLVSVSRWVGMGGIKDYRRRAAAAHGKQPAPDSFNVRVHLNFMLRRKRQDGPINELRVLFVSVITLPTFKTSGQSMELNLMDTSEH